MLWLYGKCPACGALAVKRRLDRGPDSRGYELVCRRCSSRSVLTNGASVLPRWYYAGVVLTVGAAIAAAMLVLR
jgi:hypothetical protein